MKNLIQTPLKIHSAFYSCNAGTKNREGKSFAQEWVNKTMGTVRAVVDGQTDYTDINMKEYRLDIPGLIDKWQAKKQRKYYGFSYIGSVYYPTAAKGID